MMNEAESRTLGLAPALPFGGAPAQVREVEGLRLLPPELLVKTGPVDFAEWNSRLLLGWIMRRRFHLMLSLLPAAAGRLLEVGYGSGVIMPELQRRATELFGIDVHDRSQDVAQALAAVGVRAQLSTGSAEAMPYADGEMDGIVAISALEFVPDMTQAAREMARVLRPGGTLVVVTPRRSPIADAGLRLLTGRHAEDDFRHGRERVLPSLARHFEKTAARHWPPAPLHLYTAVRYRARARS